MICPLIKKSIKIGTSVIDNTAPVTIANVLVQASGEKSRPSCPLSAKMGKNEITTSISAKKIGFPTCLAETIIISLLSCGVIFPFLAITLWICLCAFSTITIAASTIAPIAIAIPPSDIIFDPSPKSFMSKNVNATVTGRMIIIISALRIWSRKSATISMTIILSSINVCFRVPIALSIRELRS